MHALDNIREVTFGVLHLAAKGMSTSKLLHFGLTILTSAQLLLFPVASLINTLEEVDGNSSAVLNILSLLNASRLAYYVDMVWYSSIAIACLLWLCMVCGLTLTVAMRFFRNRPQSRPVLRALRASFQVSVTVLFMPLSGVALSWFNCNAVADLVPGGCWGSFHAIVAAGFAATMPVFVAISVLVTMLYIDRDMTQVPAIGARTDGRGEALLLFMKLMLTASFTALGSVLSEGVRLVLVSLMAGLLLYMFLLQHPHYHPTVNYVRAGFAGAYTWLTVSAVAATAVNGFRASWLVLLAACVAAGLGAALSHARYARVVVKQLDELTEPRELIIWAAARAQAALTLRNAGKSLLLESSQQGDLGPSATEQVGSPVSQSKVTRIPMGGMLLLGPANRDEVADTLLKQAEAAYRAVIARHADSVVGMLAAAAFFGNTELFTSRFLELTALGQVSAAHNSIDVAFTVYRRIRILREQQGPTGQRATLSTVDRVMLDQHMRAAGRAELACYRTRAALYKELAQKIPDLWTLQEVAYKLWAAIQRARSEYDAALGITRENTQLLRSYADFMAKVCGDHAAASEMLGKVQQIESMAQNTVSVQQHFEFGAEATAVSADDASAAVITCSGEAGIIGRTLTVNAVACRMLGYSKTTMLGRNVSSFMPHAIGLAHDKFIERFATSGPHRMANRTTNLLALDSRGHLIPIRGLITEVMPDSHQIAPAFSMAMLRVPLNPRLMLLEQSGSHWRVQHMCAASDAVVHADDDAEESGNGPSSDRVSHFAAQYLPELDLVLFFTRVLGIKLRAQAHDNGASGSKASGTSSAEDIDVASLGSGSTDRSGEASQLAEGEHERVRIMALNELQHRLRTQDSSLHALLAQAGLTTRIASNMIRRATKGGFMAPACKTWQRTSMLTSHGSCLDVDVRLQRINLPSVTPLLLMQWRPHMSRMKRAATRYSTAFSGTPEAAASKKFFPAEKPEASQPKQPVASELTSLHESDDEASSSEHEACTGTTTRISTRAGDHDVELTCGSAAVGVVTEFSDADTVHTDDDGVGPIRSHRGTQRKTSFKLPDGRVKTADDRIGQEHCMSDIQEHDDHESYKGSRAGSIRGGASVGHSSYASSNMSAQARALRRVVFTQTAAGETTVRSMRQILLGMALVVVLAAGVVIGMDWPVHVQLSAAFQSVYSAGERARSSYGAFQAVAQLGAAKQGVGLGAVTWAFSSDELKTNLASFVTAYENLLDACADCAGASSSVNVVDEGEERTLTTMTAASVWLRGALEAVENRVDNGRPVPRNNEYVRAVIDNLPSRVNPALYAAVLGYLDTLDKRIGDLETQDLIMFSVLFIGLMTGCAILLANQARRMTLQRTHMLRLLLHIPRSSVRQLQDQSEVQLQVVTRRQMQQEADSDQEDDNEDADGDAISEVTANTKERAKKEAKDDAQVQHGLGHAVQRAGKREYLDSGNFTLVAVARLMMPLLLVFLWLAALFLNSNLSLRDCRYGTIRVHLLQLGAMKAALAHQNLLAAMGAVDSFVSMDAVETRRAAASTAARDALYAVEGIIDGMAADPITGAALPALDQSDPIWPILMRNACPAVPTDMNCSTYDGRIWSTGMMSGMQRYVTKVLKMRRRLRSLYGNYTLADMNNVTMLGTLTMPDMQGLYEDVSMGEQKYLSRVLGRIAFTRQEKTAQALVDMKERAVWLSAGCVTVFIAAILGYFIKAAERLAESITSARALVMMVPDQLIKQLPELQGELKNIIAELAAAQQAAGANQRASWQSSASLTLSSRSSGGEAR